jgi:hypothetical protein
VPALPVLAWAAPASAWASSSATTWPPRFAITEALGIFSLLIALLLLFGL